MRPLTGRDRAAASSTRAAPTGRCRHCGSEFEPETPGTPYCSPGCATVHARIVAAGLEQYYELKQPAAAPAGRAVFESRDFVWLTEAAATAESRGKSCAELEVEVQGVVCIGCVWLIERLFARWPGGVRIEVSPARGRLWCRWQVGEFNASGFAEELQRFGYLVGPCRVGDEARPATQGLKLRLGLSAAFAMNTMLFVLPGYFGLERSSEFRPLFDAAAALFATAGLLAAGTYFARRAWAGLRAGVVNLDTPITVGLGLGEAGSLYGWWSGQPHLVYFDFVALFSFLMLIGRWTQEAAVERNRAQLLQQSREPGDVELLANAAATGAEHAAVSRLAVEKLTAGIAYRLRAGQVVPVASRLASAAATFTTEWINGEPEPREVHARQLVPAGAVSVTRAPVALVAEERWADSTLARLLDPGARPEFRNAKLERIIRVYLLAILALAAVGGLVWWPLGGMLKAVHVSLAVLVASCPCGIGLAWPLVEELAVAAARRHGVFVRELSLFPRLARVRRIVFDKTGTLTLETPRLANPGALGALPAAARARLAQLVRRNPHPVARALDEALAWMPAAAAGPAIESAARLDPWPEAENLCEEVVGQGMRLRTADGTWTLGRPDFGASAGAPGAAGAGDGAGKTGGTPEDIFASPVSGTTVFRHDGDVLAAFTFVEAERADAAREIAALQRVGCEVFVLSGDAEIRVRELAVRLRVEWDRVFSTMTPTGKAEWIRERDRRDTMMLGDGANDSLAFDVAFVRGTPVIHRGVLGAKSDFHYLGRGLRGIRELFAIAARRRRTLRVLFAFGVSYNALALALAMTGHVNPIVAAVLMPVSSLLSLGIAIAGMRSTET